MRTTLRWGSRPLDRETVFERSVDVLLSLAVRQAHAEAAFLYTFSADDSAFHLWHSHGAASRKLRQADIELSAEASEFLLHGGEGFRLTRAASTDPIFASFPEVLVNGFVSFAVVLLRDDFPQDGLSRDGGTPIGLLTLGWRRDPSDIPKAGQIEAIGQALTALVKTPQRAEHNQQLAERVTRLQTDLADRKIAERIHGLLHESGSGDISGVVREHVDRVLGSCDLPAQLAERAAQLEEQIAARETLVRAKALLQTTRGLSEEAAYLHLRNLSRRNRLPLRQVASSVLHAQPR